MEPASEVVCLVVASSGASSSPESVYPPRRLDGATHTCWCASPGTAATSRHSDDGRRDDEELPSQLDPSTSTSTSTLQRQQHHPHHHHHHQHRRRSSRDDGESSTGRCPSCGERRREEIFYTIEDLDAIESAPLESQRTPTSGQRTCSCDTVDILDIDRERGDLRKYRSTDTRWTDSLLSPDDAIWDLKKRASEGTEFRWALHTSNTDLDLAKKTRCSCHSVTPEEKKPHDIHRGDLRKHHSAETDKWSVKPDYLQTPMFDLRKHSSDDTRMAREAKWLQVPEVLPNPKPRCTCPKTKTLAPSPPAETTDEPEIEIPVKIEPEKKLYYSASLAPEEPPAPLIEKPELKKHASEDVRPARTERLKDRPKLERSQARVDSQTSKKWGAKEKIVSPEEGKKPRPKWAMRPHFSLPVEKKESKWRSQDSTEGIKSKSLRERPKYSIRRSMSPEPDPRQITKLENRIVRRLISPEITITNAKWAPYEDASPLPTIGVKKREPKHIGEVKWTPYEESPTNGSSGQLLDTQEPEEPKSWSPFHNVTPTHHPPPDASPPGRSDDEDFRWRILNQVSAFPIYQGAWKDESPEKTPPRKLPTPEDLSPPVWSPQVPATPVKRQRSKQQYSPQPVQRKSIVKVPRGLSKKKGLRARSESGHQSEDRLIPPTVIVRAASEEPKSRQRPQLIRSKALLEVPSTMGITKRSLSEEVPRMRARDRARGPNRARSEEVPKYEDPWFANDGLSVETELRQYVTTV